MIVEKRSIIGACVTLEPLSNRHLNGLSNVLQKGDLWKMEETVIPHPDKLNAFLLDANTAFLKGEELVFAIIDTTKHRIAGCTRFRSISIAHKKAVIGPTFIGIDFQRTHVNTEAKYLMLCHAFETWQLNRIELICDVLNIRSRNAIKRLGAKEEGIIRNDQIMPNGRVRDSVIHSIIQDDWPNVKIALEETAKQYSVLLSA